jgi:hypothetical protein
VCCHAVCRQIAGDGGQSHDLLVDLLQVADQITPITPLLVATTKSTPGFLFSYFRLIGRAQFRERPGHVLHQPDRNPVPVLLVGAKLNHEAEFAAAPFESRIAMQRNGDGATGR